MHTRHDLNLDDFKKILTNEKEKISKNIDVLRAEVNALGAEDDIDDVEDMAELQIDNTTDQTLLQRLEAELAEVNAALERIKAGVYGICEKTGHKIPIDRLFANPSTRTITDA